MTIIIIIISISIITIVIVTVIIIIINIIIIITIIKIFIIYSLIYYYFRCQHTYRNRNDSHIQVRDLSDLFQDVLQHDRPWPSPWAMHPASPFVNFSQANHLYPCKEQWCIV